MVPLAMPIIKKLLSVLADSIKQAAQPVRARILIFWPRSADRFANSLMSCVFPLPPGPERKKLSPVSKSSKAFSCEGDQVHGEELVVTKEEVFGIFSFSLLSMGKLSKEVSLNSKS